MKAREINSIWLSLIDKNKECELQGAGQGAGQGLQADKINARPISSNFIYHFHVRLTLQNFISIPLFTHAGRAFLRSRLAELWDEQHAAQSS